jgi:arsenate reductase (glutaredoxin)
MVAAATLPVMPGPLLVQVFGRNDSRETRAALRFFRERRIEVQFVDLARKPMAPGELRRFADRLGANAVADMAGKSWREAGLDYLRMDDGELFDRLLADQRLLRLPLVRIGKDVAAGDDPAAWRALLVRAAP